MRAASQSGASTPGSTWNTFSPGSTWETFSPEAFRNDAPPMERKGSISSQMSITVEREIMIHSDERREPSHSATPSVVSVVRSNSDIRHEARSRDSTPHGTAPLQLTRIRRHPDVREEHLVDLLDEEKYEEESVRYLIDFLKQAPPPGNLMSDSTSISSFEDNRWKKIVKFRKKGKGRRRKPSPPRIRLPDSAVAATTTGGHRHISISIPFQYSHLGAISASQYPVFNSVADDFAREIETRLRTWGPTRTMSNDRVVTVLKPVKEEKESPKSPARAKFEAPDRRSQKSLPQSPRSSSGSRPPSGKFSPFPMLSLTGLDERPEATKATALNSHPTSSRPGSQPNKRQKVEMHNQPRSEPSASATVRKTHSRNASAASNSSGKKPAKPASAIAPPSRTSSKAANVHVDKIGKLNSIDGVLSHFEPAARTVATDTRDIELTPRAVSGAPKVQEHEEHDIPIVLQPPSKEIESSPLNLNFPAPPQVPAGQNVNRSSQTDMPLPSPPVVPDRSKSRKDLVREKKKRDMEAMKDRHEQGAKGGLLRPAAVDLFPESPILGHFSGRLSGPMAGQDSSRSSSTARKQPKLTPIMIVAEVEPSLPKVSPSIILSPGRRGSKGSPRSWHGTPPSSPGSLFTFDRTSQLRRKERQAEREAQQARKARYAAKAAAEHQEDSERLSRQELVERYDGLKELRVQDMEKRLRRLERHSTVWIRSMVPMMETLTRLLQEQYEFQQQQRTTTRSEPRAGPVSAPSRQPSTSDLALRSEVVKAFSRPNSTMQAAESSHRLSRTSSTGEGRPRKRPPSLQLPEQPTSRASTALSVTSGGAPQHQLLHVVPSPVMAEFQKELQRRQSAERQNDEIDARMLRKARLEGGFDTVSEVMSAGSMDGFNSVSPSSATSTASGLETIEPLMRELQGAANARFAVRG